MLLQEGAAGCEATEALVAEVGAVGAVVAHQGVGHAPHPVTAGQGGRQGGQGCRARAGGPRLRRPACTAPVTRQERVGQVPGRADSNLDIGTDRPDGFLDANAGCACFVVVIISSGKLTQY